MKSTCILIAIVITMLFYVNSAIASGTFYNAKDAESPRQLMESLKRQLSFSADRPLVISPELAPSFCDFNKEIVSTYDESGKPIILCIWTGKALTGINPDGSSFWD